MTAIKSICAVLFLIFILSLSSVGCSPGSASNPGQTPVVSGSPEQQEEINITNTEENLHDTNSVDEDPINSAPTTDSVESNNIIENNQVQTTISSSIKQDNTDPSSSYLPSSPQPSNFDQAVTQDNSTGVKEISARDLNEMISSSSLVIIDISTPGEYNEGHIEGSLLGDLRTLRVRPEQYLDSIGINKSDTIVLTCETGSKSYMVAKLLLETEYRNVYNLAGGKIDWVRAGYDLVAR